MSDVIVQPAIEPVTLAEAKLRLEEIDSVHDSFITMLIGSARMYAEGYCNRSFITQTRRMTLDAFPSPYSNLLDSSYRYAANAPVGFTGGCITLNRGPVISVSSIVYVDADGTTVTVTSPTTPAYNIDLSGHGGRITPGYGQSWPIARRQMAAVKVNYIAGYGPLAADVPLGIRNWILLRVSTLFQNREEVAVLPRGSVSALPYVDCLLDDFIAYRSS